MPAYPVDKITVTNSNDENSAVLYIHLQKQNFLKLLLLFFLNVYGIRINYKKFFGVVF